MLKLSHKQLDVYQMALKLAKEVYEITKKFPKEEQFNLTSQMRRSAVSVCCNIAEGSARESKLEKKRFYEISRGSIVELDSQLELARMFNYCSTNPPSNMEKYMESIFRILSKMITNLRPNPTSH